MQHTMTTLRGVFPERREPYRRNFIKENVKRIREMRKLLHEAHNRDEMQKSKGSLTRLQESQSLSKLKESDSKYNKVGHNTSRREGIRKLEIKPALRNKFTDIAPNERMIVNRGIQTEQTDDVEKLYAIGVIKYPSPAILQKLTPKYVKKAAGDQPDNKNNNKLINGMQNLNVYDQKIDFVKTNALNAGLGKTPNQLIGKGAGPRPQRQQGDFDDPLRPPANYKRGVLPKYLQQQQLKRKGDAENVVSDETGDGDLVDNSQSTAPPGHVLLPESERKETLRVLRESYAEKVSELNAMPVRSDTLRMQRRKMELEDELKKIDEGIKVFQRPKVYVKINV